MTTNPPGYVSIDEVAGQGKAYRLWCKPPTITAGNPIIILVHGAVAPLLIPINELYDIDQPNNEKYCSFYQLDSFLYNDFHYNVFTFEYANTPIHDLSGIVLFGHVNYGCLKDYGEMLIEAIGIAKEKSKKQDGTVGPVYVIAHSMGGLVARYAVQDPRVGKVDKIITLDTGHLGFELAKIADDLMVDPLKGLISLPTLCSEDAAPNSEFINALNSGFAKCPELVSLAATEAIPVWSLGPEMPPIPITVVDLKSSSMGQVDDNGHPTNVNYNILFYPLPYNHVTITQITDPRHLAYQKIKESLG